MIKLSTDEILIASKILELKREAGSHSPSIATICDKLPNLKVKIDACFLSNPYATELFMDFLGTELLDTGKLRDILEFYPSQNRVVAEVISSAIGVNKENVIVGNGAIELIQAVLHRFVKDKLIVNIPTFSSYYEFVKNDTDVIFFKLNKENNFELIIDEYIEFVKSQCPNTVVIINPNNPNGAYLSYIDLRNVVSQLQDVPNIIIDESFIHFAYEDAIYSMVSATDLCNEFDNVIVIKSMSKDFGIAGIRCGYAVMHKDKVNELLSNGYLWNSSGLSEYFFKLYNRQDFYLKYDEVRKRYIRESQYFFTKLGRIKGIKVFPSLANFALIELIDGSQSSDFVLKLLCKSGVYVRDCADKIGLDGEFVRIASRSYAENEVIIKSIKSILK